MSVSIPLGPNSSSTRPFLSSLVFARLQSRCGAAIVTFHKRSTLRHRADRRGKDDDDDDDDDDDGTVDVDVVVAEAKYERESEEGRADGSNPPASRFGIVRSLESSPTSSRSPGQSPQG